MLITFNVKPHCHAQDSSTGSSGGTTVYLGSSLGVKSLKFLDASVPNTSKTFLFMRANLKKKRQESMNAWLTYLWKNNIISCHESLPKSLTYRLQPALFRYWKFFTSGNNDFFKKCIWKMWLIVFVLVYFKKATYEKGEGSPFTFNSTKKKSNQNILLCSFTPEQTVALPDQVWMSIFWVLQPISILLFFTTMEWKAYETSKEIAFMEKVSKLLLEGFASKK